MTPDERAQIRAEAVREAATWLINHVCDMLDEPDERNDGHHIARANAIQFAAEDMERALLRPDPAEASEPLQSAPRKDAPVDHGPRAAAHGEAGTLDEATVRACIAALPYPDSNALYRAALEDLLPKPDPADELVEEFFSIGGPLNGKMMDRDPGVASVEACRVFARHLFHTGRLKG